MTSARKPYSRDVVDEEWSLVVPHLTQITEAGPQREHSVSALRDVIRPDRVTTPIAMTLRTRMPPRAYAQRT